MSFSAATLRKLVSTLGPRAAAELESRVGGKVELFKLDDLLTGFQPNWRCPSESGAEGYVNDPQCWTDGRMVHFRGDLIHVGDVGEELVAGWASAWTPAMNTNGDSYVAVDSGSDHVNHDYVSACTILTSGLQTNIGWFLPGDAGRVLHAGSDGLNYLTVMGSYLLASAVA